nr:gamma-glutamyltransferase [Actinomycetota bacterium]
MVATSHPLATGAGVRALEHGGNAVDAALAAAAMLCVAEPGHTGVGGDLFAQLWWDGKLVGLNGSGRAPGSLPADAIVEESGPHSVTVPGAVRAWADLAERFGRLGLDAALTGAIESAESGVAATERVALNWASTERSPWPAPARGEIYRLPALAATLRRIAAEGPDALYRGRVAEQIAVASWLAESDLAAHASEWVEPVRLRYRDVEVCELPPNGQGAAALIALGLLEGLPKTLHSRIEATKLALADAYAHLADEPLPTFLLEPAQLAARRALVRPDRALEPEASIQPRGGTTYLCAVDGDRNAVSLIQSIYYHWGSGVLAGDTGIVLQNRAWGFTPGETHPNRLAAGRRPFHTIIP